MTNSKFKKWSIVVILCILLIAACYVWVDRPISFWVTQHHFVSFVAFKWFTYLAKLIVAGTFLFYLLFAVRLLVKANYHNRWLFLANSVVITIFIKDQLKFIFGRYWPMTWVCNNSSLIKDHAYGFHFFHGGQAYSSFPSGHTAITVAAMMAMYLLYPRLKWLAILVGFTTMVSLVAMNYHFISDVIAGAVVGVLTTLVVRKVNQALVAS